MNMNLRSAPALVLLSGLVLLSACDGDGRPFEEAVEVQQLDLASLEIVAEAALIATDDDGKRSLFINSSSPLELSLKGTTNAGNPIDVSGADRRWRLSDDTVGSITENGVFTGTRQDEVNVDVTIGEVTSPVLTINVSDAELSELSDISGDDAIARCIPSNYQAIGLFADGTTRVVNDNVDWRLADADADNGREAAQDNGATSVTGLNVSMLTLTAAVGDESQTSRMIEVSDTLRSIAITPASPEVTVEEQIQLTATGTYSESLSPPPAPGADTPAATDDNTADITQAVSWAVAGDTPNATVTNTLTGRGAVTGTSVGMATVSAACGTEEQTTTVNVIARTGETSDGLSLNVESPLRITSGSDPTSLILTAGDNRIVTNQADWSSDNLAVASVSTEDPRGQVSPVGLGETTIRARFENSTIALRVIVSQ